MRFWVFAAGVLGAAAIAAKAYQAHSLSLLPGIDEARIRSFASGAEMLTVHALALLALATLAGHLPRTMRIAGTLFLAGALLFAVPTLTFALAGSRAVIFLAPIGGGLLIAGWTSLAAGSAIGLMAARRKPGHDPH